MSNYTFKKIDNINNINLYVDSPFKTKEWLLFLKEYRNITPIVYNIYKDESYIGMFIGGEIRILMFRLLGSPFPGNIAQHMGFSLSKDVDYIELLDSFIHYFKKYYILIIIRDINFYELNIKLCREKILFGEYYETSVLDLTKNEDEIFKSFKSGYRTCVRKFEKENGSILLDDFSDDFIYNHNKQLKEVYKKDGVQSPDITKRLKLMFKYFKDTNMLLSLIAANDNNINIASSYYLGFNKMAIFISNASYKKYLNINPNQALMWCSIKYWKSLGIKTLDMCGPGDYKLNFGAIPIRIPSIIYTRFEILYKFIIALKLAYYNFLKIYGNIKFRLLKEDCK